MICSSSFGVLLRWNCFFIFMYMSGSFTQYKRGIHLLFLSCRFFFNHFHQISKRFACQEKVLIAGS
jgi:hypothetical protein